ncbi:hypothetical protein ScPMuIL_004137 [Solemya velum]
MHPHHTSPISLDKKIELSVNKEKVQPPADYQVLLHAISSCAVPVIQQLLSLNQSLIHIKGWHGQTPLHRACLGGDWNVCFVILQAGADANVKNDFDETPVHYVCKRGVSSLAHLLFQYGGDFSAVDKQGKSVVHHAAQTGSVYMLHYLAIRGIDLDAWDSTPQTPLHIVCQFGHVDAFKYLIRKQRSDPSLTDNDGNTALHLVAREGHSYMCWLLLARGSCAQLHKCNKAGLKPLDMAEHRDKIGHREIVPILKYYSNMKDHSHRPDGPVFYWYWSLIMPAFTFSVAILLARMWGNSHQGLVFFIWMVGIMWDILRNRQHRLKHVCRWADPVYAGMFGAGLLHSIVVYFFVISPQISQHVVMLCLSLIGTGSLLAIYWKVLTQPPGEAQHSILNEQTGLPMTLIDVCHPQAKSDAFCISCEIIRTRKTKHCKICEKCYIHMDHHCLFLMRCVAHRNHRTFIWFSIIVVLSIIMFIVNAVLYCNVQYHGQTYTELLTGLYHQDAWVLSMLFMNLVSLLWGLNLLKYQLFLVSVGQTTVFQSRDTALTTVERVLNVAYFLQGKQPFVEDPLLV